MNCPSCGSFNTACKDSRQKPDYRYRRYHCINCGKRFSTKERYICGGAEETIKQMLKRIRNAEMELREARNQAADGGGTMGETDCHGADGASQ